jgi:hypothetical protein
MCLRLFSVCVMDMKTLELRCLPGLKVSHTCVPSYSVVMPCHTYHPSSLSDMKT